MPNHYSEHYPPKEKNAQESVLAPIFGDLSRSKKKLSEIKAPLVIHSRKDIIQNQNVILCKNENWNVWKKVLTQEFKRLECSVAFKIDTMTLLYDNSWAKIGMQKCISE